MLVSPLPSIHEHIHVQHTHLTLVIIQVEKPLQPKSPNFIWTGTPSCLAFVHYTIFNILHISCLNLSLGFQPPFPPMVLFSPSFTHHLTYYPFSYKIPSRKRNFMMLHILFVFTFFTAKINFAVSLFITVSVSKI